MWCAVRRIVVGLVKILFPQQPQPTAQEYRMWLDTILQHGPSSPYTAHLQCEQRKILLFICYGRLVVAFRGRMSITESCATSSTEGPWVQGSTKTCAHKATQALLQLQALSVSGLHPSRQIAVSSPSWSLAEANRCLVQAETLRMYFAA